MLGTPKYNILIIPTTFPTNAPKVSSGKNIPPGTPEPNHTNVNKNLTTININNVAIDKLLSCKLIIRLWPPPNNMGDIMPTIPVTINGIIIFTSLLTNIITITNSIIII